MWDKKSILIKLAIYVSNELMCICNSTMNTRKAGDPVDIQDRHPAPAAHLSDQANEQINLSFTIAFVLHRFVLNRSCSLGKKKAYNARLTLVTLLSTLHSSQTNS